MMTIVAPAGPTTARTVSVQTDAVDTEMWQSASASQRGVKFVRDNDTMTQFVDPEERETQFGYEPDGLLSYISAPGGTGTEFTYDSSDRVISITQIEDQGGPGSSVTRLSYPSATSTLLAGPNTDQGQAVSAVPHTSYTINASQRVSSVVDAAGRTRSATYTANFDTLTATTGSGSSQSTTTNTYGANSGESQTKTAKATGAADSLAYANPAGPSQYQASSGTDDAGNASTYTYNGSGNQLTSTNAASAQGKVTRNTDGTIATATSPGNGTNNTSYGYTNKQLTSMTPVTGSSLGNRANTYNEYGLVETSTNGRGITTTYTYDELDRVTNIAFTGGDEVTYSYDAAGNLYSRVDEYGTTTYIHDQLYRLTFRENSTFGGEINYAYDKASNIQGVHTDAAGWVYNDFDDAGIPTKITYTEDGTDHALEIATDSKGRRTDIWMDIGTTRATWKARHQIRYDNSDRVNRVVADTGNGDTDYTRVLDTAYCRVKSTTAPTCTANATNDRNKIQWQRDTLTTALTSYTYDTSGRLTQAAITGPGAKTYNYTYNSNGNRLTATAQSQTLTYNPANQISSSGYSYDGAGNMTAQPGNGTITYTAADQLASVTKGGNTYYYDHAGVSNDELIAQTTPDGTYKFAYGRENPQGVPVVETVAKGTGIASVINDPVTGQPLMLRTSTGRQALYIYDGTPGSPIALLSSDPDQAFAYDYDPYGVPTITEDDGTEAIDENPYTFAGGLQDRTTNWVHYAARYYDPKTGSFTQQDTLDTPLDPLNANRYAYAGNDPINNTDPTGRVSPACVAAVLALTGEVIALGVASVAFAITTGGASIIAGGALISSVLTTTATIIAARGICN